MMEKSKILLNLNQKELNYNSLQNPGIDAYNNSINIANNQLNPNNTIENNINLNNQHEEEKEKENKDNINMNSEEIKKENEEIENK